MNIAMMIQPILSALGIDSAKIREEIAEACQKIGAFDERFGRLESSVRFLVKAELNRRYGRFGGEFAELERLAEEEGRNGDSAANEGEGVPIRREREDG